MMERGGAALHSNLRLHSWPLLSCSRVLLRPAPKPFLATRFRHYTCSKGKGYLIMKKALVLNDSHTSPRALKSCGQGANVNNEEMKKHKFLIDCGSDQECVLGGIVALGKFDALHIGHRELVIQASKVGRPFLLSFVGMAEVLGWDYRAPIVAKSDRKRVLPSWAPFCGNVVPLEFQVQFSNVRHLTPRQFVERLSEDLRVSGVVAGENYRFGYKASGDATELVRLCNEYGLSSCIVDPVMDKTRRYNGIQRSIGSSDRGQVSSSRVRNALAMGDMDYVAELLGRKHCLVLELNERCRCTDGRISAPRSCMLNQPPKDGEFDQCNLVVDDKVVGPCRVVLDSETVNLELDVKGFLAEDLVCRNRLVGLEFGRSKV